jgi:uncharacterized membrane protein (DUF2068 family)
MARLDGRRDRVLLLIALFRFGKAALLIAGGLAAFELLRKGAEQQVEQWVSSLPMEIEQRLAQQALRWLLGGGPKRIELLGISAFAYAGLFILEGIGLWRQRPWGEYLTIIAGSSLLPFEIYAAIHRVTALRVAVLVTNMAIVIYLIWRVRTHPRG